jgi:tight adherence protein B
MGFLFIAFLIFSGAFLVAGYYAFTVPQQQIGEVLNSRLRDVRLRGNARTGARTDLMRSEDRGTFEFLEDFFKWLGPMRRLQEHIEQANLRYRAGDVISLSLIVTLVFYFLFGLFGMTVLALRIVLSLGLGALPVFYIMKVRARRMNRFQGMLPDTIDLFNRSMKAGHNIHSGLETIAQETLDPVRMEFKKLIEELALGSPIEAALHNLGKRMPLIDLKFFITGLILQRQTGANMVQVLENLALLIRERLNLVAKMQASTAQQRLSAGLLCVLPLVVGLGFWIVKPEYIQLLYTDEVGSKFLTYAIISEIIGILIVRKIANPKF